jgi:hypothetical protein
MTVSAKPDITANGVCAIAHENESRLIGATKHVASDGSPLRHKETGGIKPPAAVRCPY